MSARQALPRGVWLMVAALWGLFLAGMYHTGKLPLFQASPYYYFTASAGVLLVILAAKGALWPAHAVCGGGHRHDAEEPCGEGDGEHGHRERSTWSMLGGILLAIFLMIPALMGMLVPHRSLNAFAAMKRGTGLDSSELLSVYRTERRRWQQAAGEYVAATTLDVLEIGRDHPGLKVRTVGFVYRSDEVPADMLTLVRFKITCCAADATPVAVAVRWAESAKYRNDTWVEVRGTVERQRVQGREVTVIVADDVREVAAPDRPYL